MWNRSANDHNCTTRIRDTLRRVLNLPPNTPMEYKSHGDSLKYLKSVSSTQGTATSATTSQTTTNAIASGSNGNTTTTFSSTTSSYVPPITRNNGTGNASGTPTSRFFSRPFTTTSHS